MTTRREDSSFPERMPLERPCACGIRRPSIDANGRFSIPASFIDALGPSFHMTVDEHNNIVLFPSWRFREIAHCLMIQRSRAGVNKEVRHAISRTFAYAEQVTADTNNRVQIPESLKEIAPLPDDSILLVGDLDRIVLWPEQKFNTYKLQYLSRKEVVDEQGGLLQLIPETLNESTNLQRETEEA